MFTLAPDPHHLPYEEGSLDVVFSVGVLEHVRDTGGDEVTSLAEIRRVLTENGLLICCHFPNQWSWIDWTARLSNTRHCHDFRYTKSDIVRLTGETGFELKELKRYGILPRNSLGRVSPRIGESEVAARLVDAVDDTLGLLLWPIVQNFGFVARAHP
ncbi:MAG: methyltransferase domain-containing protein [Acidimicrobiales bacterium]